jgi:hypothetical protein
MGSLNKLRPGVIPIYMLEVREPERQPEVFIPLAGSRWGKSSAFNFIVDDPTNAAGVDGGGPGGQAFDERTDIIYEILSVPNGGEMSTVKREVPIQGYTRNILVSLFGAGEDTTVKSTAVVTQHLLTAMTDIDLGDEQVQVPIGVTLEPGGGVTEHFMPVIYERRLKLSFGR